MLLGGAPVRIRSASPVGSGCSAIGIGGSPPICGLGCSEDEGKRCSSPLPAAGEKASPGRPVIRPALGICGPGEGKEEREGDESATRALQGAASFLGEEHHRARLPRVQFS